MKTQHDGGPQESVDGLVTIERLWKILLLRDTDDDVLYLDFLIKGLPRRPIEASLFLETLGSCDLPDDGSGGKATVHVTHRRGSEEHSLGVRRKTGAFYLRPFYDLFAC